MSHFEIHKSKSVLQRKPVETDMATKKQSCKKINIRKIFGEEIFERLISDKIKNVENTEEMVNRRQFVEQIKKMVSKHPFIYAPYFIEDVFVGQNAAFILKKYAIPNTVDWQNIMQKTLGLKGKRYRQQAYSNSLEMNMKIPTWKNKYETFRDNCTFFAGELLELLFYNLFCSSILVIMMDHTKTGAEHGDIILRAREILGDNFDIYKVVDEPLKKRIIERYFGSDFERIGEEILSEMIREGILQRKRGNWKLLIGTVSIDKIKDEIVNELRFNPDIHNETHIRDNVTARHPSIRLILNLDVWKTALFELEDEKLIRLESRTTSKSSALVFLNKDYLRIQQKLSGLDNHLPEFHGRKISPQVFIDELLELERGDFGDRDDQVTRIAGLVLAESIKMRAPHESLPEFDFSTDITNYNFRPEQLQVMKRMNFVMWTNIFHCKVMLEEKLTVKKYKRLKHNLPSEDQGIVVTFVEPTLGVKQILEQDKSIQIIDKDDLKSWASITPTIPARKGSVVRLHYDPVSDMERRVAKVNIIDYESGLASVTVLPEVKEVTVMARALEEIEVYSNQVDDFAVITDNYFEFLTWLSQHSEKRDFIEAIFDGNVKDLRKITLDKKNNIWEIELANNTVTIEMGENNANKIAKCSCYHGLDSGIPYTFCKHLITALDKIGRERSYFDETWNSENSFKNALTKILAKNFQS